MPIVSSDIQLKRAGAQSLGGIISDTDVSSALHGLFDVVLGSESLSGAIEYRCIYVKNNHPTLTLYSAVVFVMENTISTSTNIDIGLGTSATSGEEQTIANEKAAPVGVTFGAPADYANGYPLGDLAPGQHKAVWIRRTVSANASAYNNDGATIAVQGDTAA